ncbi:MAG: MoaD/ThiS family protein [Candidatus Aenigmarchaeota archaeon]|nr:MoaD/ThiS family protein [Candidatus Aenigmarchaeota archaeon]
MKIKINDNGQMREINISGASTVAEAAKKAKINLPSYLAKIKNNIVPDTQKLNKNDTVEFFKIISGG